MEWSVDNLPRTPGSMTAPKQWFCLFRGDTGPMGVAVQSVAEVLETDTLVQLPWSPPQVVGMCSFHREVIPIVVFAPPARDFSAEITGGPAQAIPHSSAGEKAVTVPPPGCVVLILKSEHGAWGLRVDSESTIISQESPRYHAPRMNANGPVVVGTVERAGTCHEILDVEATWSALRYSIGRWSGLISDSNPSSPLRSQENPGPAVPGSSEEHAA
jgi:chemotaxis signal transduction protein